MGLADGTALALLVGLLLAAVLLWRGLWNLVDRYLLPHHALLSNLLSVALGLGLLLAVGLVARAAASKPTADPAPYTWQDLLSRML